MRPDVLWLNGPFGVGKTTVARALSRRIPRAVIADPEHVGFVLARLTAAGRRASDFQELEAWPVWTVRFVRVAARLGTAIVPMTLDHAARRSAILRALHAAGLVVVHVTLVARPDTISGRLLSRGDASASSTSSWVARRNEACFEAFAAMDPATRIETDARSVDQIASEVLRLYEAAP